MAGTTAVPQYTYSQLMNLINTEANGCAAGRKGGLRNLTTSNSTLFNECKNGLMLGKYKYALEAAIEYENINAAELQNAALNATGISPQTIGIATIALLVLIGIAIAFRN